MSAVGRYLAVGKITWKTMLAYQADTWLGALVVGFRILLTFLLWKAIYSGQELVGGYTFTQMITYSLVASVLARLQHQDALAWQLAGEVRDGVFSRYLVYPVSVTRFFVSAGLGRWVYLLIINLAALVGWGIVFSKWVDINPNPGDLIWLVVILPLGALGLVFVRRRMNASAPLT
jgi:ABC-2 type transport system permease protein